jgi:DtxR family Mn-dependent transcriptional regulator
LNQKDEEILEAIWVVSESGSPTIEAVQGRCPAEFSEEDFSRLQGQGNLVRNGSELFLTQEGKHKARTLVRCHRLAESLLYTVFDLDWEQREAIACEAEHTLVPELADEICTLLGHPTECPDGKPIPPGVCCVTHQQMIGCHVIPLSELEVGSSARILFVKPKNHDRLHEVTAAGLTPGVVVTLHQRSPTYCIRYDGTELALDHRVAQDLFVCPSNGDNRAALVPNPHRRRRRQGLFHWLRLKER